MDQGEVVATDRDGRVLEGFRLFTEETFGGNGRTCATCHPVENNLTVDPASIRRVPRRDPLFVAETNRALRKLEIPALMRKNGLILENLDGFSEPGMMRGVPHTLGLALSIRNTRADFPLPGNEALGWSGDGSPGDGTLREFAIGAVTQHFPKTLERRACSRREFRVNPDDCDFRLPTRAELADLLAFQLFTGRDREFNLAALDFTDDFVNEGNDLFAEAPSVLGTRSCAACHRNGGANDANGDNRQFATGANLHPRAPACLNRNAPGDGGFGPDEKTVAEIECYNGRKVTVTLRGDQTFNTPSLIEAADTGPFFHNNVVATIEKAVDFYTTDTFNNSPSGGQNAFVLTKEQTNQIAALLRALNVLENIRSGNEYDQLAYRARNRAPARALRMGKIALAETIDAIQVLRGGPVRLFRNTDVASLLNTARNLENRAIRSRDFNLLRQAAAVKDRARDAMLQ
ncbi:MAG: hypothetical protein AAF637_02160 [Pseudomonadota bacterium]